MPIRILSPLLAIFLLSVSASDRPNILFIYTDDQSTRTVSSYEDAYHWVNTPNIDRLAEEGIRFTRANIEFLVHGITSLDLDRPSAAQDRIASDDRPESNEYLRSGTLPVLAKVFPRTGLLHRPNWQMAHGSRFGIR